MKPLLLLLTLGFLSFVHAAEKPNVILIYTDDHGWPDIGVAGIYHDLKTPHIDALATSGVYATNGYSTAPQCVPSRAGVLSGRSQNRFGVDGNGDDLSGFNVQSTIAERLKGAGYATGQIGKWHLGPSNEIPTHGFDDVYAKNANRECAANFSLEGKTIPMQMVNDNLYHLDACSKAALTFIDRHADESFFLYLAYRAPHVPLDAPEKYLSRFPDEMPERRRQALAMISAMDDGIGQITADLKERGIDENTLIFFIGDNGAPLKIHQLDAPGGGPGWDGSLNKPMNGEKGMLSEGGMRVPFIVSYPGTIPGGQIYEHPIWSLDVAATAVALAGLPDDPSLDGVNIVPHLSGKLTNPPHKTLIWRWIAQAAIREGNWKLLVGGDREYLYDLESDRGETSNLISSHPEIAERLRSQLNDWADEMQPPGLNSAEMSPTWENYYDFYLDGKPAAPLHAKLVPDDGASTPNSDTFKGWTIRNGTLNPAPDGLVVTPTAKSKAVFLVLSAANFSGPVTANLELNNSSTGRVVLSWREDGQKDFPKEQTASTELATTGETQQIEITAPVQGKAIHFRLHLPLGRTTVSKITFSTKDQEKYWDLKKSTP